VSVPMSDPERQDARGQLFRGISLITLAPPDLWDHQIRQDNTRGREVPISTGSARPIPNGRDHIASEFPSVYAYTLSYRITKFNVVTHLGGGFDFSGSATPRRKADTQRSPKRGFSSLYVYTSFDAEWPIRCGISPLGRGDVLAGQPAPSQGGGALAVPNFGGSLYSCVHRLTQRDQIWHGNMYGGGACFWKSATPLDIAQLASRGLSAIAQFIVSCRKWAVVHLNKTMFSKHDSLTEIF